RSSAAGRSPSSRGPSSISSSRPRDGRCSGGMDSDDVPFLERRPARGDDHIGVLPALAHRRAGVDLELERPGGGSSPSPPPPGAPLSLATSTCSLTLVVVLGSLAAWWVARH